MSFTDVLVAALGCGVTDASVVAASVLQALSPVATVSVDLSIGNSV